MKFTLAQIKKLVDDAAVEEVATGDEYLDTIYEKDVVEITGHTNPYYLLWYLISDKYTPDLVVELGSWRAFGAAHFAVGGAKQVVTIDIHKDSPPCHAKALEVVSRYDNLDFIHKWTWDAAEDVKEYGPIDVLFIDAWHEYQYVVKEWELYEPLLADEALVICDDIFDEEGATVDMVRFWEEISKDHDNFLTTKIHDGIQMGFIHYKREVEEPKTTKKTTAKKTTKKSTGTKK